MNCGPLPENREETEKLRQNSGDSLKMCTFGQLFSSLNLILISLELKITGESFKIDRFDILRIYEERFRSESNHRSFDDVPIC